MNQENLESRLNDVHKDALSFLCPILDRPILEPIPVFIDPLKHVSGFDKCCKDPKTGTSKDSEKYGIFIAQTPWHKFGLDRTNQEIKNQCESDTVHETGHYIHTTYNPIQFKAGPDLHLELVADYLTLFYLDESCRLFDWSTECPQIIRLYQSIKSREERVDIAQKLINGKYEEVALIPRIKLCFEDLLIRDLEKSN